MAILGVYFLITKNILYYCVFSQHFNNLKTKKMTYVKEILVVIVALVVYDMLVKKMINKAA